MHRSACCPPPAHRRAEEEGQHREKTGKNRNLAHTGQREAEENHVPCHVRHEHMPQAQVLNASTRPVTTVRQTSNTGNGPCGRSPALIGSPFHTGHSRRCAATCCPAARRINRHLRGVDWPETPRSTTRQEFSQHRDRSAYLALPLACVRRARSAAVSGPVTTTARWISRVSRAMARVNSMFVSSSCSSTRKSWSDFCCCVVRATRTEC